MSFSNQAFPSLGSDRANDNQQKRVVINPWQTEVKSVFLSNAPTISDQAFLFGKSPAFARLSVDK